MRCIMCDRHHLEILGQIELTALRDKNRGVVELLYLSSTNHLVCGNCVSNETVILRCDGKSFLSYDKGKKKYRKIINREVSTTKLNKAEKERDSIPGLHDIMSKI